MILRIDDVIATQKSAGGPPPGAEGHATRNGWYGRHARNGRNAGMPVYGGMM